MSSSFQSTFQHLLISNDVLHGPPPLQPAPASPPTPDAAPLPPPPHSSRLLSLVPNFHHLPPPRSVISPSRSLPSYGVKSRRTENGGVKSRTYPVKTTFYPLLYVIETDGKCHWVKSRRVKSRGVKSRV